MKVLNTILVVIILLVVVIFLMQNWSITRISFVSYEKELPLSFISIGFYILGALTGGLLVSVFKKSIKDREEN